MYFYCVTSLIIFFIYVRHIFVYRKLPCGMCSQLKSSHLVIKGFVCCNVMCAVCLVCPVNIIYIFTGQE